jgi:hypothetical protein
MSYKWVLFLILLLMPVVYAKESISTDIQVYLSGEAQVTHYLQNDFPQLTINTYDPESLTIDPVCKYQLQTDSIVLINASKGTTIRYLSQSIVKKDKLWELDYFPNVLEYVRISLPINSEIVKTSAGSLISKGRTGNVIEWSESNSTFVQYKVLNSNTEYNYKTLALISVLAFFITLGLFIWSELRKKIQSSVPKEADKFLERIKGIKRPIVRQVIYALLILAYQKGDKLIDQSKVRAILKNEGYKKISDQKSVIHGVINGEIDFLINRNESKIEIKPETEDDYDLKNNAKRIIAEMKKQKLIYKEDGQW